MEPPRRNIPGTISVQGREFAYIESGGRDAFDALFPKLTTYADELPGDGGAISTNAVLSLPDGRRLYGISYRGDLEGWRRAIEAACGFLGYELAMIEGDVLRLSDGTVVPLADCVVEFY